MTIFAPRDETLHRARAPEIRVTSVSDLPMHQGGEKG
jgi:hypothetical protein